MDDEQSNSSSSQYIYEDLVSSSSLQSTCREATQPEPSGTKRKRQNERFTKHQIHLLEKAYSEQKLQDGEYRKKLASEFNVTQERVKSWHNNRMTKQRINNNEDEVGRLLNELQSYRMEVMRLRTIMSNCSSCNCLIRRRQPIQRPIQAANVTGPFPVNEALANHVLPANALRQPLQLAPQGYLHENQQHNVNLLKNLQGVRKVCEAAYKEIMKLATEANLWIKDIPELGSLEPPTLQMFHGHPPSGMKKELSIENGIIPLDPLHLISIMLNVNTWASMLSNIVYRAHNVFPSELQQLRSIATEMKNIQMVNAELHFLTHTLQMWRYQFLRYCREVAPNVWAIVDISDEYLFKMPTSPKPSSEVRCRRRPSGLIIRKCNDKCSEVIWIENMEVCDSGSQNDSSSSSITSNLAFCAKKWMVTLLHSLKRNGSEVVACKVPPLHITGCGHLLDLANLMRMAYFERVNWSPNASEWVITNDNVRIMRKRNPFDPDALGLTTTLYAAASFVLVTEPRWFFEFLSGKLHLQLQHLKIENTGESEIICQLTANDGSNSITLCKKGDAYFVEEDSLNEFCYYKMSSVMSQPNFGFATPTGSWTGNPSIPSGFVILPLHVNGRQSVGQCQVTFVASFSNLETSQADSCVTKFMRDMIANITKELQRTTTSTQIFNEEILNARKPDRDLTLDELGKGIMSRHCFGF